MAVNFTNETDPKKVAAQQRALIQQRGDDLIAQQQQQQAQSNNNANQTQGWLNSYLQPMVEGTAGGYNPQELASIQNSSNLSQFNLTPDQAASNFLSPEVQSAIKGNTASYGANFNPDQMSQNQDV